MARRSLEGALRRAAPGSSAWKELFGDLTRAEPGRGLRIFRHWAGTLSQQPDHGAWATDVLQRHGAVHVGTTLRWSALCDRAYELAPEDREAHVFERYEPPTDGHYYSVAVDVMKGASQVASASS